jgi:hypothetical protein
MDYISTISDISDIRFGHAWRDDQGATATVRLGRASLYFDSAEKARDAAAACTTAAEALDELAAASGQPAEA